MDGPRRQGREGRVLRLRFSSRGIRLSSVSCAPPRPLNGLMLFHGGELAAVLRASGPDFDVDAFVADCRWNIAKVFHRGEALLPKTRPEGRKRQESGLNASVSKAGLHQFAEQVEDAVNFLTESMAEVQRLVAFPGVTGVVLDFGIAFRDVVAQSDQFSSELVRLAGAAGVALELSLYPVSDGDAAAG